MKESHKVYWEEYARAFAYSLQSNSLLNKFITNTDVTGAYSEAWMKSIITTMLPQFRVSTGAIISPEDQGKSVRSIPQCDVIIWDPSYFPALFEFGDFALVSVVSARAIVEVKRKCKDIPNTKQQLARMRERLQPTYDKNVLGVVISHPEPLIKGKVHPTWARRKEFEDSPAMTRLLDEKFQPDPWGIIALIYFLSLVAGHK